MPRRIVEQGKGRTITISIGFYSSWIKAYFLWFKGRRFTVEQGKGSFICKRLTNYHCILYGHFGTINYLRIWALICFGLLLLANITREFHYIWISYLKRTKISWIFTLPSEQASFITDNKFSHLTSCPNHCLHLINL